MYLGIDGCKAGWLVATITENGTLSHTIISTLWDLQDIAAIWAFIDIPLGFAEKEYRSCEVAAQQLLGPTKRASIFLTPHRASVYAESYAAANALNKTLIGKGISKQAWNICPKIREADAFVKVNHRFPLYEAHPELCFYYLNNRQPLFSKKADAAGAADRLQLITAVAEDYGDVIETTLMATKRKDVKMDDILDATVLAIRASSNELKWVPKKGGEDHYSKIYF